MGSGFLSAPARSTSENSFLFFFFYYGGSEAPPKVILMRVFFLRIGSKVHIIQTNVPTQQDSSPVSSLFSSGNSGLKLSD